MLVRPSERVTRVSAEQLLKASSPSERSPVGRVISSMSVPSKALSPMEVSPLLSPNASEVSRERLNALFPIAVVREGRSSVSIAVLLNA